MSLKKIISITLVTICLGAIHSRVLSAAPNISRLRDSNDSVYVGLPTANGTLSGTVPVTWNIVDDENSDPTYKLNLLKECSEKIGTLTEGKEVERFGDNYVFNWQIADSGEDFINIDPGNYCLSLEVNLLDSDQAYRVTNNVDIKIADTSNLAPSFGAAESNFEFSTSEEVKIDLNVNDRDLDELTLKIAEGPDWLEVNSDGELIGTPSGTGPNTVILSLSDDLVAETKIIGLNVVDNSSNNFKFTLPSLNYVVRDSLNVEWESESIEKVDLEYTRDGLSWVSAGKDVGNKSTIDTSNLTNGKYYLRALVKNDNGDVKANYLSEPFLLSNPVNNSLSEVPIIYDVSPLEDSYVTSGTFVVSGKYVPSSKQTIDAESVEVSLNDSLLSDCEYTETDFSCNISESLDTGLHRISVAVADSGNNTTEKSWEFNILENETITPNEGETPTSPQSIDTNTIIVAVAIIIGIIVLIGVPWIIFSIWKKSKDKDEETEEVQPIPEPVGTTQVPVQQTSQYSIGKQDLTSGEQLQPEEEPITVFEPEPIPQSEQPSWLIEENNEKLEQASEPVTPSGETPPPPMDQSDIEGSQPHGFDIGRSEF